VSDVCSSFCDWPVPSRAGRGRPLRETAWVVIDADWNLHVEACAYLASLRAADRSPNTERVYAGRVALFLNYCEQAGVDWHDPEFAQLHAFLRWLVTEPVRHGPARQSPARA
jgi:integrase/recombinase XerD